MHPGEGQAGDGDGVARAELLPANGRYFRGLPRLVRDVARRKVRPKDKENCPSGAGSQLLSLSPPSEAFCTWIVRPPSASGLMPLRSPTVDQGKGVKGLTQSFMASRRMA